MSCDNNLTARRNADFRVTFSPASDDFTFADLLPELSIRRDTTQLLLVSGTVTPNGSNFIIAGDSAVATIKEADLLLLDGTGSDLNSDDLHYDLVMTDATGFRNWVMGGAFILAGLNDADNCGSSCGSVEIAIGGQCFLINIDGGNLGPASSVGLAELNQAVGEAKQAADDAQAAAQMAASAGAAAGSASGSAAGAAAGSAAGAASGAAAGLGAALVLSGLTTVESALQNISANVEAVRTTGHTDAGDGGSALYTRVPVEPTHAGKFQSADGAWWELALGQEIRVEMFGARGDLSYTMQSVPTGSGGGTEGFVRSSGTNDRASFEAADAFGKMFGVRILASGQYFIDGQFMPQACWFGQEDHSAVIWCKYGVYERGIWIMSSNVRFEGFSLIGQYDQGGVPKPGGNGHLGGIISAGDYYTPEAQQKLTGIVIDVKLCRSANNPATMQSSSPSILATNMGWTDMEMRVGVFGKTNASSQIAVLWHWGCKYTPDATPAYPPIDRTGRPVEISYHPTGRLVFDDVEIDNADGHNLTRPFELASPGPCYVKPPRCANIPQAYWMGCGDVCDAFTNREQAGTVCTQVEIDYVVMRSVPSTEPYVIYYKFVGESKFEKYDGNDLFLQRQIPFGVRCKGHYIDGGAKGIFLNGSLGCVDLGTIQAPNCTVAVENEFGVSDVTYVLIGTTGTVKHESVSGGTIKVLTQTRGDQQNVSGNAQDEPGWNANNRAVSIFGFQNQTTTLTAASAEGATRSSIAGFTDTVYSGQKLLIGGFTVFARGTFRGTVGYIDHTPLPATVSSGATVTHIRRAKVDHLHVGFESTQDGIVSTRADIASADISAMKWSGQYAVRLVDSTMVLSGQMPTGVGRLSPGANYTISVDKDSALTCVGMRIPTASSRLQAHILAQSVSSEYGHATFMGCLVENVATLVSATNTVRQQTMIGCVDYTGATISTPGLTGNDVNGYWEYRQDGVLECWLRNVSPAPDGTYTWTFPKPFLSTAAVAVMATPTSLTNDRTANALNSSSTQASVVVRDGAGSGVASGVSLHAIGRWY